MSRGDGAAASGPVSHEEAREVRKGAITMWATAAAIAVLGALAATATAGRLSTSNNQFRAIWAPLSFTTSEEGEGISVACSVTVEGSFHYRSIIKASRSLIGYVTKAVNAHPCEGGGEVWTLNGVENTGLGVTPNTLPWHISYEGFEGSLPSITGVRFLLRPTFVLRTALSGLCLYGTNIQGVIKREAGGGATGIVADATIGSSKVSGGIFCAGQGFFGTPAPGASNRVTVLGAETRITITLI
jgi:hypothetical protein